MFRVLLCSASLAAVHGHASLIMPPTRNSIDAETSEWMQRRQAPQHRHHRTVQLPVHQRDKRLQQRPVVLLVQPGVHHRLPVVRRERRALPLI